MVRVATCRCGALTATCSGEPVRISVCHCHDCQRRSGSAFAAQARFAAADVATAGDVRSWETVRSSRQWSRFHFCPTCGSTVWYENEGLPGFVTVAMGAFADDDFPPPTASVYENRMKPWVRIVGEGIERN